MLLLLILMIGGLSLSSLPFTSSISVFSADNVSFFLVHRVEMRATTSCPFSCSSILAFPEIRITISSAYAMGSHSIALSVKSASRSSNVRFQKLGPIIDPCVHPFVMDLLTVSVFPVICIFLSEK
jgi:hypothetical protein